MSEPGAIDVGVRPGDVLAGKYRVERLLGVGGMGAVVAAHHLQLDEKVALKFLLPQGLLNPEAKARFLREARAAAKIKGEHVARVSDVGELDNGAPYIVMEYLDGYDLAAWLSRHGRLPSAQACDFVLQACEALADAHAAGIVHRDLKPANLFCVRLSSGEACIKVLDFGISKVLDPAGGHDMTRTTAVVGSPTYMSPEQMQHSKGVDVRTDVWSLGVILYELLAGKPPFEGAVITELAIQIATAPTPSLAPVRPDVPPGLVRVLERCLEKDRARRFQNVAELAVALGEFGSRNARVSVERVLGSLQGHVTLPAHAPMGAGGPAGMTGPGPTGPSVSSPGTVATWGTTGASRARPPAVAVIVAGTLITLAVAGGGVFLLRRSLGAGATAPASSTAIPGAVAPPIASAAAATAPSALEERAAASSEPAPASAPAPSATAAPPPVPASPQATAPPAAPHPPAATPSHASAPAAPPAAKPSCNPPYYYDAKGNRLFKKECL